MCKFFPAGGNIAVIKTAVILSGKGFYCLAQRMQTTFQT